MKQLWRGLGILAFWLSWPLLWLAFYNSERSRLVMVHDGKFLLTKGWLGDGKWGTPGGGKHHSETPKQSLIREVREELGINLNEADLQLFFTERIKDKGCPMTLHYFLSQPAQKPEFRPRVLEVDDIAWITPSKFNSTNAGLSARHAAAEWSKNL